MSLSHDGVEAPPPPPFHGGKGCYICSGAGVFLHMVDYKNTEFAGFMSGYTMYDKAGLSNWN